MKNNKNNIGFTTVLKSISLDDPTYYDYFTIKNSTVDKFLLEEDCLNNDEKTSTEIVVDDIKRKFKLIADYANEKEIDCDCITFNVNYGVVCEDDFAKKYKNMIQIATDKFRSFNDSVDINDLASSKKLLEAYKEVIRTFRKAETILNDTLEDYVFSNLISFRLLSVDLSNYFPRINKKEGYYDIGVLDLLVRDNPELIGDKESIYLVSFNEFISKMRESGFEIETSDCKPINNYKDYLEGYKKGEFFRFNGDLDMILHPENYNDGLNGLIL